jgi:transposase
MWTEIVVLLSQGDVPSGMGKLASVSRDALQTALADVSTGKAAKRLMIALAYKDGVPVDTLSERYAIPRSTVYYWLDRFEELSIEETIEDDDRPGRPPALTAEERDELRADLALSLQAFDFDATMWSTETVCTHIAQKYGVEYSYGHVRRLLRSLDIQSAHL